MYRHTLSLQIFSTNKMFWETLLYIKGLTNFFNTVMNFIRQLLLSKPGFLVCFDVRNQIHLCDQDVMNVNCCYCKLPKIELSFSF